MAVPVEKLRRGLDAAERRFQCLVEGSPLAASANVSSIVIEISSPPPKPPRARPMEMG